MCTFIIKLIRSCRTQRKLQLVIVEIGTSAPCVLRHNYRSESCAHPEINDHSRKCLVLRLSGARSSPFNWEQGPLYFIVQHAILCETNACTNTFELWIAVVSTEWCYPSEVAGRVFQNGYGILRGHCITVTEHGNKPQNSTHILFWLHEIRGEDGKLIVLHVWCRHV